MTTGRPCVLALNTSCSATHLDWEYLKRNHGHMRFCSAFFSFAFSVDIYPSSSCEAYLVRSASSEQLDNPWGNTASVLKSENKTTISSKGRLHWTKLTTLFAWFDSSSWATLDSWFSRHLLFLEAISKSQQKEGPSFLLLLPKATHWVMSLGTSTMVMFIYFFELMNYSLT